MVTATDSAGASGSSTFTWYVTTVTASMANQTIMAGTSVSGVSASDTYNAEGSQATCCTWSATGLPSGISISSATGALSGDSTSAGSYDASVSATDSVGATSTANFTWLVEPASPTQVVITSSALDVATSASATHQVSYQMEDQFGNAATSSSPTTVTLSSTSSKGIFAGTSGGSSVTSVTLAANQSAGSFYYGDTGVGSPSITVSSPGLTSASQTETIVAAAPSVVTVTSPAFSMTATSSATQSFTVGLQDGYGNASTSSSATTVTLSSTSAKGIFAATSGGSSVTQATIPANTSSITLYYGDKTAGSPTIMVSSSGLTSATQSETVTAASPSKVVITSSSLHAAASSSATHQVSYQLEDQFGNDATSSSPTTVTLSSTSSKGIFAATSGGSSVTSVTLAANQSAATFYYGDTGAGTPTITVSSSGLTSATQTETIVAAALSVVTVTSSAFSMTATSSATQSFTVGLRDAYGNATASSSATTVTLSSTSAKGIFAATSGGSSVTQATIPANTSSLTLYYGDETAGSPTITVSSLGLTSATQAETVKAASPSKVVITSSSLHAGGLVERHPPGQLPAGGPVRQRRQPEHDIDRVAVVHLRQRDLRRHLGRLVGHDRDPGRQPERRQLLLRRRDGRHAHHHGRRHRSHLSPPDRDDRGRRPLPGGRHLEPARPDRLVERHRQRDLRRCGPVRQSGHVVLADHGRGSPPARLVGSSPPPRAGRRSRP